MDDLHVRDGRVGGALGLRLVYDGIAVAELEHTEVARRPPGPLERVSNRPWVELGLRGIATDLRPVLTYDARLESNIRASGSDENDENRQHHNDNGASLGTC